MNISFKEKALVWMIEEYKKNTPGVENKDISIIELGCGIPLYVEMLLTLYPGIRFTGVEPLKHSYTTAVERFKNTPSVKIIFGDGGKTDFPTNTFDIVFSFSVLEHVKFLDAFLLESVRIAKPGALILHRYDLGHALYPSSIKERFQVFLGNTFPWILPVNKFVCYVNAQKVADFLDNHGARSYKTTYHQMPNHKMLEKKIHNDSQAVGKLIEDIVDWEMAISPELKNMEVLDRERLFPAVAVWATKNK